MHEKMEHCGGLASMKTCLQIPESIVSAELMMESASKIPDLFNRSSGKKIAGLIPEPKEPYRCLF